MSCPRYAISDAIDLSSAQAQVSKMTKDGMNGSASLTNSIVSVKSSASPAKRKAEVLEDGVGTGDRQKKTRRGHGGKRVKK